MTRFPQARDFIEPEPTRDPKPIAERLRQIAAQSAEEPAHVLIERMAKLLAEHFDQRR